RRFGLVGIDNRDGNETIISGINFYVENLKIDNPCKHMWREMIIMADPNVGVVEQLSLPDNYTALDPVRVIALPLDDNFVIIDDAVKIFPHPPWEELITIVTVPAGSYILLDELHLATECIPEPATVTLGVLGAGTLLALRRRRRQRQHN
ncbi:MAG TPA: PEP-CTERM sorting domain-containing protein, partial [Planctomycetota bacterium]|nr:PEP-CTERM sorting domain-containing protein [Planctomycetota bacterium]